MQNQERKKLPGWLVLTVIALVVAVLLSATYLLTKEPIEKRAEQAKVEARQKVLPLADYFEELDTQGAQNIDNAFLGVADGQPVGYIAQSTTTGYAGDVETIVGMDLEGQITGITVGGSKFEETPGLGAKAKDAAFTDQFTAKQAPVALKTDVDAITGATITSNAVIRGVNQAATFMMDEAGLGGSEGDIPENVKVDGKTAVATVEGYAGPIEVTVTVDGEGNISAFSVGGEAFAETEGFGSRAKEAAFTDTFIGKTIVDNFSTREVTF